MVFRIGLENNYEGRSLAWALEHPGCFAYGEDGEAALANMPQALEAYTGWIADHHCGESWLHLGEMELRVDDTWQVYDIGEDFELVDQGYSVNAWFLHDWKPLVLEEIERGLELLTWSRADLLELVSGFSPEALKAGYPGERWSIEGILKHIGGAEWWYLDRLGLAFPRQDVPEEALARLEKVRAHLESVLPTLPGSKQVVGVAGEWWSPRKLLRRAVQHERDHFFHVRGLLKQ